MHYGKTAKTDDTPFLKEQIGIFNDVSKYVMAMILNKLSPENRAKSMEKFVKMSKVSYSDLFAVFSHPFNDDIKMLSMPWF